MCAVGTVDWANKWSKEAFIPDKPHNYGEPDYKALAVKVSFYALFVASGRLLCSHPPHGWTAPSLFSH